MRRDSSLSSPAMALRILPKPACVLDSLSLRPGQRGRNGDRRRVGAAAALGVERRVLQERLELRRRHGEAGEPVPFLAVLDPHALLEARHLLERHQAGVIVLVAGEGQALALDRVGDEAGRRVVADLLEGVEHGLHVVAGEVGHQPVQAVVLVLLEDAPDAGILVEVAASAPRASPRRPCRPAPSRASWGSRRSTAADARRRAGRKRSPAACRTSGSRPASRPARTSRRCGRTAGRSRRRRGSGDCSRSPTTGSARRASSLRAAPRRCCPRRARRRRPAPPCDPRDGPPARAASAAHSPARSRRTASSPRRGRPSRSRNRRRRHPWCATDRIARRPARGSVRASRGSDGRTGTGWRGTPARRAASPRPDPRASAPRNKAPSSPSRARRRTPGGRRPSVRRGWAAGGWRDGSSRTKATGPCAPARGAGAGVARGPGWSSTRHTPWLAENPCVPAVRRDVLGRIARFGGSLSNDRPRCH